MGSVRQLCYCPSCDCCFSETRHTATFNLKTSISRIHQILDSLTEGQGINVVCRIFHVSKNSIYRWQERLSELKPTLLLYALCHQCLMHLVTIVEGQTEKCCRILVLML